MKKCYFNNKIAKLILLSGYKAITLLTFSLFKQIREKVKINDIVHEMIHGVQQEECIVLGFIIALIILPFTTITWNSLYLLLIPLLLFYVLYGIEWLISLFFNKFNGNNSYHTISFEEEAYENEKTNDYLKNRKHFAWIKYYGNIKRKK